MLIPPAYAQAAGGAAASSGPAGLISLFAPFALVLVAFYFVMYLPQQRKQKAFQATIDAVKKGDQVLTSGGIVGRVTKVEDKYVEVEIAPTTRVRVLKSTLAEVMGGGTKPAND